MTEIPIRQLQIMAIRGFEHGGYHAPPIGRICEGWLPWRDYGAPLFKYEELCRSTASGVELQEVQLLGLDAVSFIRATKAQLRPRRPPEHHYRWQSEFDDELFDTWNAHAKGVASSLGYEEL